MTPEEYRKCHAKGFRRRTLEEHVAKARTEALEEAAKVAEANDDDCSHTSLIQEDRRRIAAAIRALKSD